MNDNLSINHILAKHRKDRAWSQNDLAMKLKMKQSQISDIEAGNRDPRLSTVTEIARALGLEMVLVPRQMLPAVSYILRSKNMEEQAPEYESLNNEDTKNAK